MGAAQQIALAASIHDPIPLVHGIHYMNNLGLFLFKDSISFGVAFYLISYHGRKAIRAENQS
jgi:hypothetical protein